MKSIVSVLSTASFIGILFTLSACSAPVSPLVAISGNTMGTTYSVKFVNHDELLEPIDGQQLKTEIDDLLVNINQLMSTYIDDSELSRLNKTPLNTPFKISPETNYVLQEAIRLNQLSQGMLDVTVGPLVNLWGFGPQLRPEKLPNQAQLNEISQFVGIDKFTLQNGVVVKKHDKVYIDLSTIAKGYGVDQIAELLIAKGLNSFLVEIGGEMRVSGKKPHDQNWLVAIEKPITQERALQRIIHIGDNAIASSGDYRNYFEEGGVRYSHLINPINGYPIKHNLVSVSVVAEKSMTADGLATALIVMGKEAGIQMAEKNNIAALFITKEGNDFVEYTSAAFDAQVNIIN